MRQLDSVGAGTGGRHPTRGSPGFLVSPSLRALDTETYGSCSSRDDGARTDISQSSS